MSDLLRGFRRNVVHVRQALDMGEDPAPLRASGGFLQDQGRIERYKRLATPVRRALNATDRVSFVRALEELRPFRRQIAHWDEIESGWARLQEELASCVALGGGKIARGQILARWLEAAAFYDAFDRHHAYDDLINDWGPPAEDIGWQLTREAARLVLRLDEAAAAQLEEPVILPPPPKMPPPPPERVPWWRRWKKRDRVS
jgi:hypothetical protein